jgi:hypothetical protein
MRHAQLKQPLLTPSNKQKWKWLLLGCPASELTAKPVRFEKSSLDIARMPVPSVFISYSHDSPAHEGWVLDLARFLVSNGIDVVIDAWNLRAGEDIPRFMEDGVTAAERVLMICTERYVDKADGALGGVGYEKMIVTSELIKNLGTAKFVPIVRQSASETRLPRCIAGRYYIDLSEGAAIADEQQKLLRELHSVPPDKPTLGPSPFSLSPTAPERP